MERTLPSGQPPPQTTGLPPLEYSPWKTTPTAALQPQQSSPAPGQNTCYPISATTFEQQDYRYKGPPEIISTLLDYKSVATTSGCALQPCPPSPLDLSTLSALKLITQELTDKQKPAPWPDYFLVFILQT